MQLIHSLLNNPELNSFVNTQVFAAVLLALLIYRFVAPVIDYLNPFIFMFKIIDTVMLKIVDIVTSTFRRYVTKIGRENYARPDGVGRPIS